MILALAFFEPVEAVDFESQTIKTSKIGFSNILDSHHFKDFAHRKKNFCKIKFIVYILFFFNYMS